MIPSVQQPSVKMKFKFALLATLFFLLSYLFGLLFFSVWSFVFDTPRGLLDLFVVSLLSFGSGIYITSPYFWHTAYSRFSFNVEDVLIPQQQRLGYVFILAVYALVTGIYIITPLSRNYDGFYYVPVLITYSISLIKALLTRRSNEEFTSRFGPKVGAIEYKGLVMPTGDFGPQCKETMHGSASWITDQDKNALTSSDINGLPTFDGLWIGGGFFNHHSQNLMSVAPPGMGKGTYLIIPNLLWKRSYPHSFLIFDPKGTNACITARFRMEQGHKVYIFDPIGLQKLNNATHGIPSSCFNPLDHIVNDIFNGTLQIANLLIPDEPGSKDKYWNTDARNLVHLILMHIMTCDTFDGYRNLISLHQIMISGRVSAVIDEAVESAAMDGLISDTASGFAYMIENSKKTFSSVVSIASASLKWLSNPSLQKALASSDFDPRDLDKGNITIYICQPIANKEGFATYSRLITGACLRANSMPASAPKAWVYYLLDEFPTMGIFPEVVSALAFSREYRMRIWLFAQSIAQVDNVYNQETRNDMLGNIKILQSFGSTDLTTTEYISKKIGNQTVRYYTNGSQKSSGRSHNHNPGSSGGSSYGTNSGESNSTSEAYQGRPLITPDEVGLDGNIITITKEGPMRLFRFPYYMDVSFKGFEIYNQNFLDGRADPNPNI